MQACRDGAYTRVYMCAVGVPALQLDDCALTNAPFVDRVNSGKQGCQRAAR